MSSKTFPADFKPVIAVDWDGTCVPAAYPLQPTEWLPGAVESLRKLTRKFTVYIYTTRIVDRDYRNWSKKLEPGVSEGEIAYIRNMLNEAGLTQVRIFESYPGGGPGKISAKAYIDDLAVPFTGDWSKALEHVANLTGEKHRYVGTTVSA